MKILSRKDVDKLGGGMDKREWCEGVGVVGYWSDAESIIFKDSEKEIYFCISYVFLKETLKKLTNGGKRAKRGT